MAKKIEVKTAIPLHDQVYDVLRADLLAGKYKVGEKMPTTPELLKKYKVNSSTLQRAMTRLVREGYVERSPRRGTFVKRNPRSPRVAILLSDALSAASSGYTASFTDAVTTELDRLGWEYFLFDNLGTGKTSNAAVEAANKKFREENQSIPFRGAIEFNLDAVAKGVFSDARQVYTVGFGSLASDETVALDVAQIVDESVQQLKSQGCSHVYYLRTDSGVALGSKDRTELKKAAAEHNVSATMIEVAEKAKTPLEQDAYFQILAAAKTAGKAGFICTDGRLFHSIDLALAETGKNCPVVEISADANPAFSIQDRTVCSVELRDIAKLLCQSLEARMTGAGDPENPKVSGALETVKSEKAPAVKTLKKAWKPLG